jgi:type II secretory pathway pseudopilin PulG
MKNPRGFTYLELSIAMLLLGMIVVVMGAFANSGFRLWRATRTQLAEQEKVRNAMQRITKEIREMKISDNGSFPVESASQQSIVFFANVDSDTDSERVRVFYQSNQIKRGVIEPTGSPATYPAGNETVTTIADYVYLSGNLFNYYDQNYTGSEAPLAFPVNTQDVHLIEIHFQVDMSPNQAPNPADFQTQVTARNLKEYAPSP